MTAYSNLKKINDSGRKFLYANKSIHKGKYITPHINFHEGLEFLVEHFNQDRLFPRTIMTRKLGYHEVRSEEEMLQYFKQADGIDYRINAYPSNTRFKEIQRYPPDFIFIDLDLDNFKSELALKLALNKILNTIREKLDGFPTVLFTGGGYHIYQPIEAVILENISDFNPFDYPSQQFLKFAEQYLTNHKADPAHNPAFKSCLLRVPGSINSRYNTEVKIIQMWNGYRPHIRLLLGNFLAYLVGLRMKESKLQKFSNYRIEYNSIPWIEKLLQTPIEDGRKTCLWRILCPYLVNVKKLSFADAFLILKKWLDECDKKRGLEFNPDSLIKTDLKNAGIWNPIGLEKLKQENKELYRIIKQNIL